MTINLFEVEDKLGGFWWEYLRVRDFGYLTKIADKKALDVEDDDILIHKEMAENDSGMKFPEKIYHQVLEGETFEIASNDVRLHLAKLLVGFINQKQKLPFACEYAKHMKNGAIAVNFTPTKFDNFQLKFRFTTIKNIPGASDPDVEEVAEYIRSLSHVKEPQFDGMIGGAISHGVKNLSLGEMSVEDVKNLRQIALVSGKNSVFVNEGTITKMEKQVSDYQGHETVSYILEITGGSIATMEKDPNLIPVSMVRAKCSENGMEKYELAVGNTVSFGGKVNDSRDYGWLVQNIRKFEKK